MNFNTDYCMVFLLFVAIVESRLDCDLNCEPTEKCVLRRSTCLYPPCPKFPVCEALSEEEISEESEIIHPGTCPQLSLSGPCMEQCSQDGDCEKNEKCCLSVCGKTCTKVEKRKMPKPGTCPAHLRSELNCGMDCMTDMDCPGSDKCCRTACGSSCSKPCYYFLRTMNYAGLRSGIWTLPYICRL